MIKLGTGLLFFVSLIRAYAPEGCDSTLAIRRFVSPDYPNVARLAQVSGDVHLRAKVAGDGRVETADVLSGPSILASYARKNVQSWQFTRQPKEQSIEIVYRYRLREPKVYGQAIPSVSLESPTEVVITSNLPFPTGYPE